MNLCSDGHFIIHGIVALFFQNYRSIVEVFRMIPLRKDGFIPQWSRKCGTLTVALVLPHGGYAGRGAVPRIENLKDGNYNCHWIFLK
jgi:hypothetical protein